MKESIGEIYENSGCVLGTLVIILIVILALGMVFGAFCLEGWIFMLLWNWLAVQLFDVATLGYWVCVGIVFALNFLGKLIFGRTHISTDD